MVPCLPASKFQSVLASPSGRGVTSRASDGEDDHRAVTINAINFRTRRREACPHASGQGYDTAKGVDGSLGRHLGMTPYDRLIVTAE